MGWFRVPRQNMGVKEMANQTKTLRAALAIGLALTFVPVPAIVSGSVTLAAESGPTDTKKQNTEKQDAEKQDAEKQDTEKQDDKKQSDEKAKRDWLKAIVEGIFESPATSIEPVRESVAIGKESVQPYQVALKNGQVCLIATLADGSACLSEGIEKPQFRTVVVGEETYLGDYVAKARKESSCQTRAEQVAKDLKLVDGLQIKLDKRTVIAHREALVFAVSSASGDAIASIGVDLGLTRCYYQKAGESSFQALTRTNGVYQLPVTVKSAPSKAAVPELSPAEERAQRVWLIALVEGLFKTKVKRIDYAEFDVTLFDENLKPLLFQCYNGKDILVVLHPEKGVYVSEGTEALAFRFVKTADGTVSLDEEIADCHRTDEAYVQKANDIAAGLRLGDAVKIKKYGFEVIEARIVAVYLVYPEGKETAHIGYVAMDAGQTHCYYKEKGQTAFRTVMMAGETYELGIQVK